VLELTPLKASFTRGGLRCNRLNADFRGSATEGMIHQTVWVAGNSQGAITFVIMKMPDIPIFRQGLEWGLYSRIGNDIYMGTDIGRHTTYPIHSYDREYGPHGPCMFLDGLPCYYDGSGMAATELLKKAVTADSEEVIWNELIAYHEAWIGNPDVDDETGLENDRGGSNNGGEHSSRT